MEGQLSLFDPAYTDSGISVIDGGMQRVHPDESLKCFKNELKDVQFLTRAELFSGFNTLKAITFSYNLHFLESVLQDFEYAEIILGGDFLVRKDANINDVMVEALTNAKEAGDAVKKREKLVNMMKDDRLVFRTPTFILDHRKLYILKSDDGRTRVITSSANMSYDAWNNSQIELYEYDDTEKAYDEYNHEFEAAWSVSEELPFSMVSSKKSEDLVEGNAILKKVLDKDQVVVFKDRQDPLSIDMIKYAFDHEKLEEEYRALISGVNTKGKYGLFEVTAKELKKIVLNKKKLEQERMTVNQVTETYPTLRFDVPEKKAFLNDEEMDLSPAEEEVRNDIDLVLKMFENYKDFVTTAPDGEDELRRTHFKLLNAMFISPFHAKIRCLGKLRGKPIDNLPMVFLAASDTANCGKTFAITAALKMMTGKDLEGFNKEELSVEKIRNIQISGCGVPVFIDELDSRGFSNLKGIIKNPEKCENQQRENQPVLFFASNDVLDPDDKARKRIGFLRFDGSLKSTIDQNAYKGIGVDLKKKLGTGLYREYLRTIIGSVKKIHDDLSFDDTIPAEWYPDLMELSSKTLINIFAKYGYEIPDYMAPLTWYADYSANAAFVSGKTIDEIRRLYRQQRKLFKISDDTVIIECGGDNVGKKQCQKWKNTLPPELHAEIMSTRDTSQLLVSRNELEKLLGFKLGSFWENLFR